jgi:zinc transport system permease protein
MFKIFEYQFIQNAIIASILASIIGGIIGVIIVEKKLVMMSGGIAHTSYGGVGLGYLLGFEPLIGAFIISIISSLAISYIKKSGGSKGDLIIGMFWSFGMALGILFISIMPGYPPEISSYLFGSILSVTKSDINLILITTIIIVFVIVSLFNYWKMYIFDEEFAKIRGINTSFMEYLLFVVIAIAIVALIRVMGIVLVLTLLTAPPAIAEMITHSFLSRIIASIIISSIFLFSGLFISYLLNIPSGASIAILSTIGYFAIFVYHKKIKLLVRR